MSYITAIGSANPSNKVSQASIADFMVRAMNLSETEARKLRALYQVTGIQTRYSVIPDYGKSEGFEFYSDLKSTSAFPSTKDRMDLYKRHSLDVSLNAIKDALASRPEVTPSSITHLITVSCTGMYAPGLDIDIINALGLPRQIHRVCVNFMGCYAAFNALKLAQSFCLAQSNARVLMICTELCSIHFQKENTPDNLLANALFADGSAALLVESAPRSGVNLKIDRFLCSIATEGSRDMAWSIGDTGFEMKLSSYVPSIIRTGVKELTEDLLRSSSGHISDVTYFAIHPGGKKILEVIEDELGITTEENRFAYEVLRNFGNMSSATVIFVLQRLFKSLDEKDHDKKILSLAFGPGLTLESMLLIISSVK